MPGIARDLDAERALLSHAARGAADSRAARRLHREMCERIEQAAAEHGFDPLQWRPDIDWLGEGREETVDQAAYGLAGAAASGNPSLWLPRILSARSSFQAWGG